MKAKKSRANFARSWVYHWIECYNKSTYPKKKYLKYKKAKISCLCFYFYKVKT